uniref:glutathione-specific gamma-glutamylcyclotransferase n=1 Tax=Moniliophthora roreri TaxID=221103 RepID=A0A0W0EZN8_MONRR
MSHSWDLPSTAETESKPPFIVFGYGSLIFKVSSKSWKPTIPHSKDPLLMKDMQTFKNCSLHLMLLPKSLAFLEATFAVLHKSPMTIENPGRVVTLIHKEDWDAFSDSDPFPDEDVVWAYTIDPVYEAEVRDYLDYREKDGYTMETLDVYGVNEQTGQETVLLHGVYVSYYTFTCERIR